MGDRGTESPVKTDSMKYQDTRDIRNINGSDYSLLDCSSFLFKACKGLERRNKELSDIVLTIANEVLRRANYEEFGNEEGIPSNDNKEPEPISNEIKSLVDEIRKNIKGTN